MTPSAHTNFNDGYSAYIETAMRLVQYELDRIPDVKECDIEAKLVIAHLSAIKVGLQIALDNIERNYTHEAKAIETLEAQPWRGIHAKPSATLYHFGTKAD